MEQENPALEELDALRADVLDELLPERASLAHVQLGEGWRERLLIDVLTAMCLVDRVDPAHPWSLAAGLFAMGSYYPAAMAFLEAESRFRRCTGSDALTGDEGDWAESCIEHAEDCFRRAAMGLSKSALNNQPQPEPPENLRP